MIILALLEEAVMKPLHEELREIRLKAGISLEEIAKKTKIRYDYLERIETGDFSMVPLPFIRAFLREYAVIVGIDPNLAMSKFDKKIDTILSFKPDDDSSEKEKINKKVISDDYEDSSYDAVATGTEVAGEDAEKAAEVMEHESIETDIDKAVDTVTEASESGSLRCSATRKEKLQTNLFPKNKKKRRKAGAKKNVSRDEKDTGEKDLPSS